MSNYNAPIRDMQFVLRELAGLELAAVQRLPELAIGRRVLLGGFDEHAVVAADDLVEAIEQTLRNEFLCCVVPLVEEDRADDRLERVGEDILTCPTGVF